MKNSKVIGGTFQNYKDKHSVGKVPNGSINAYSLCDVIADAYTRIPSSFWQLFWSCIYGPYLLYKVRNISDTHLWRLQTIICIISG